MARAGFVTASTGHPATYWADPASWTPLLGETELPQWRQWASIYAFLAGGADWSRKAAGERWSSYVLASRARTLLETHEEELRRAGFEAKLCGTDPEHMVHLMERFQEWTWDQL